MLAILHTVYSFVAAHALETVISVLTFLGATLLTYAREQVRSGAKWVLAPLTRIFPWNSQIDPSTNDYEELISDFSLIDVFLWDADGKLARYQKTSTYVVTAGELDSYHEGVTTEGFADAFRSMRGTIAETVKEHGFYISRIDLGDLLKKGSRFQNVYTADLHDCFTNDEEHWTQEIAFPTKHLTLQIHFPKGRPPRLVKCKVVEGVTDKQVRTDAKITELSGKRGIVWEIQNPKLKDIYKLEWLW